MDVPEHRPEAPVIQCPNCQRALRALRTPRCNWCGAPIPAAAFQAIAAQSQHVMALTEPPPLPPVMGYSQQSGWGGMADVFLPRAVRSFLPNTPGQSRLRLAVLVLFGLLAVAEIAHHLYALWIMHRVFQMLPPH